MVIYSRKSSDVNVFSKSFNNSSDITCNSSTIIDHILTNSCEKIVNSGVIDLSLSDHQMIFCTRKLMRQKFNFHKHIKCRSLKKYTPDMFVEELKSVNFPNYENFNSLNDAYSNFMSLFMAAINKVAPLREIRVKNRSHEWFDGEISNAVEARNEKLKTFKRTRDEESLDEESLKRSEAQVQNLIENKKKVFIENKLKDNVGKPKELWKVLKSLGLPKNLLLFLIYV